MAIDAVFDEQDDRGTSRRTLRLGVAARLGADDAVQATVRNLSTTGILIESPAGLAEGEAIEVDLPEAGEITARVVWSDAPLHGCRFDAPISPAAVSAALLRGDAVRGEPSAADDFGGRLHRLRKQRGLSLADVANRLSVSKPTVWAWEHNKSRPVDRRLPDLAEALGVSAGGLEAVPAETADVIEASRREIAQAHGVAPSRVRILIEL